MSNKAIWSRFIYVGLSVAALCSSTQAATVSANSGFFKNWAMATFSPAVTSPVVGTPIQASVTGQAFTITASNMATSGATWSTWGGILSSYLMSSTDLPAAIGLPTPSGNVWELGGGEVSIKFSAPMPANTTLFSHDFDNTDAVEYRFYRCDGTQVDATVVEFLQIATANNPVQTPPVAGAADSFWKLASPTAGVLSGTTSGLIVKATDVCEIRTKELGLPGHSTVDFQLGVPPAPLAVNDMPPVVPSAAGGTTFSVLLNDTVSGKAAVVSGAAANATLTPGSAPTPAAGAISMDSITGVITIATGTTPGTYTYPYTLCSLPVINSFSCSTATATIVVAPSLQAVNDVMPPVTAGVGGVTPSVLANDTADGKAVVLTGSGANATLIPGASPDTGIVMNTDGTITVKPGTAAGTYTYPYKICSVPATDPATCSEATATVMVGTPAPVPVGPWWLLMPGLLVLAHRRLGARRPG